MNFEEEFKSWTLDKKVEWALGPKVFNLSEKIRSVIVDLKADNERLKAENAKLEDEWQNSYAEECITRHENHRLEEENAKLKKEVAGYHQLQWHHDALIDYINQLRYERLMEKARRYRAESNNELCVKFYWDITEYKPTNEIIEQLSRIAEAYEARVKRFKEGKC